MTATESPIRWPDQHRPDVSSFLAVNELQIDADPACVLAWLRRPDLWSSYYSNARLVRHLDGPWPEVELGSRWRWLTFGSVLVTSEIVELELDGRLAWSARELGARGHHAWLLEARQGGTYVCTEETQRGWAATLARPLMRPLMTRFHQRWLEGLARVAAEGPPPAP